MRDGFRLPQTLLLIGGTSEIGTAIAEQVVPGSGTIVLAGRDADRLDAAAARLEQPGRTVHVLHYDALAPAAATVDVIDAATAKVGDLDVVVVAVGVLADENTLADDPGATERALRTNLMGPMTAVHAAARQLRRQGHGALVVLSSVAAVRTRAGLLTYGVAKAALDDYTRKVSVSLRGTGVQVLVVRPGQVRTRMSAGLAEPPFTTGPGEVARIVDTALRRGRSAVVYSPPLLRTVMTVLRTLPPAAYDLLNRAS